MIFFHVDNKMKNRVLNHRPSPRDVRDHVMTVSPKPSLPSLIDLSALCTTVKDQGEMGSCTAFACVGLMEHVYRKCGLTIPDDLLSERFLYYVTRVNIEKGPANDDSGAYIRDVLKAMNKFGVCLEKCMPYNMNYSEVPSRKAYTQALNYQIISYTTIQINSASPSTTLKQLKTLLSSGNPFVGGVICYSNFFDDTNGLIPLPKGQMIGGHALLFVGYDDASQVFKFKNSWGTEWGDNGYGYLPYAYLTTFNMLDLWTVYTEEYNNVEMTAKKAVLQNVLTDALTCVASGANSASVKNSIDKTNMQKKEIDSAHLMIDQVCKSVEQFRKAVGL